jgi:hypothetical protein
VTRGLALPASGFPASGPVAFGRVGENGIKLPERDKKIKALLVKGSWGSTTAAEVRKLYVAPESTSAPTIQLRNSRSGVPLAGATLKSRVELASWSLRWRP